MWLALLVYAAHMVAICLRTMRIGSKLLAKTVHAVAKAKSSLYNPAEKKIIFISALKYPTYLRSKIYDVEI